jgi:Ca-activated chloride channel family protein
MADAGGGNFQYIESAEQIADFVASEVGEALAITVREGVLVVDAGEGAVVESLNDFPCRQEDGRWRVAIGSLFSGQLLAPVLRVTFPEGKVGHTRDVTVRVEDQDGTLRDATATARFTWAGHPENDRQPRERAVDRQVAALHAAQAERNALACNRKGDYAGARRALEACAARIDTYAGDDAELEALAAGVRQKAVQLAHSIDKVSSKALYSVSSSTLKGRSVQKRRGGGTPSGVVH